MKKLQSITGILFAIVFILFAYWQFNDPDPILWVPIYATASYVAFQSYRDQLNSELVIVLFILTTAAGIQLWSENHQSRISPRGSWSLDCFICICSFLYHQTCKIRC